MSKSSAATGQRALLTRPATGIIARAIAPMMSPIVNERDLLYRPIRAR